MRSDKLVSVTVSTVCSANHGLCQLNVTVQNVTMIKATEQLVARFVRRISWENRELACDRDSWLIVVTWVLWTVCSRTGYNNIIDNNTGLVQPRVRLGSRTLIDVWAELLKSISLHVNTKCELNEIIIALCFCTAHSKLTFYIQQVRLHPRSEFCLTIIN